MLRALAATLGRPAWWSMALAAFLVRGGILLVLLPIIVLPTPAELATTVSPTIQAFAFGGLTADRLLLVLQLGAVLFVALAVSGLVGAWLDLAQLREAARDEDLDLAWEPAHPSIRDALTLRLIAHLPTLAAAVYAAVRLVGATYDELLAPGDATTSIVIRVLVRAPDAIVLLGALWLVGETVGALATRRSAAGAGARESLWRSTRHVLAPRGASTLLVTTSVVGAVLVPFLFAAATAWDHLRSVIFAAADPIAAAAALLVLIGVWILGLAVLGAALAWRGAAWTAEVAPPRAATLDVPAGAQAEPATV